MVWEEECQMKNPFYYRSTINRLNQLMGPANPGHVRLRAVTRLLRELSPQSPGSAENVRTLRAIDAFEFARHKLRDLYDRADSLLPASQPQPVPVLNGAPLLSEEDQPEEDDDPL